MRRLMSLGAVIVVLLALAPISPIAAQEATPEGTGEMQVSGDLITEQTNFGIIPVLVPTPAAVNYFRVTFPPGAVLAYEPGDPGTGLWVIESGTMTLRNFTGDIIVARVSSPGAPGADTTEMLDAGTETKLRPGDGFVWASLLGGEVRNDTTEPVVFISFDMRSADDALPESEEMSATPTP